MAIINDAYHNLLKNNIPYSPQFSGGGPVPPRPDEPIILKYADGWFEHQDGNWVLVKAGQKFNVDYKMSSSDSRHNKQYIAGDEDTWFNMDNEEWINAYGIDCGNTYNTNSVIAAKLTLPNCQDKSYTGNGLFYNAKELICVDITTKSYIGKFWGNSNLNNAIITIKENALSMSDMFYNCFGLVELVLDIDRPQGSLNEMFQNCYALYKIIGIEDLDVSNVTIMNNMFNGCNSLQSLDLSNWDTSNVTTMSNMFQYCYSLQSLDLSNWNTSNVTSMNQIFYGCYSLQSIKGLENWDVSNVTSMGSMFRNCSIIQSLDLSNWNTSNATSMNQIFYQCYSLQSINLNNWNTSKVTNMSEMFSECRSLQSIKGIENWDVSNVTNIRNMFNSIDSLRTLDLSNWDVSSMTTFFPNAGKLLYLKLTNKPKTVALSLDANPVPLSNYSLKWLADNFIDISGDSTYTDTTIKLGTADKYKSMYPYFVEKMTAKGYTISIS